VIFGSVAISSRDLLLFEIDLMFACSFTGKEFRARKSTNDHPSKIKTAAMSVRVTQENMYV